MESSDKEVILTFSQSILSRTWRNQWNTCFVALATAAAVAPDVAGPTIADTLDWVTRLVVTEAASAVSRLVIFIDYFDLFSIDTTCGIDFINGQLGTFFVQLFRMQLKNLISSKLNPILIVFSSTELPAAFDAPDFTSPQAARSATLASATNDRANFFLHLFCLLIS